MKVMWIVNTIFPVPSKEIGINCSCFGGWAHSLYESIKKIDNNINFSIVSTYSGKKFKRITDEDTTYYLIPNKNENKYNKNLKKYWKKIIEEYNPDVVHIHGTEYPRALPLIELYPNLNYVVSIQGLIYPCSRVFNANLNFSTLVKNITIRDILKPKTGLFINKDLKARAVFEQKILNKVNNVIGRTNWDKAETLAVNPNLNYYHCEENLRECFYNDEWNINKKEKYTIFFSQAQSILKGFYLMVEALKILKRKYPDVKVVVAGNNLLDRSSLKVRLKRQSYTKYLQKLIKKYNLSNNIEFTGYLSEKEYKEKLIKCHVYAQTSSMENSSNALGEAMILGMPCVASNVGGTSDMLIDKKEGFLYPYTEPELLAYYIEQYFESDDLCKDMGKNARKHALKRHDWDNNAKETLKIYKEILEKK